MQNQKQKLISATNEELYALAQKAAHIGSWDWDIQSGQLKWSETIESIFGFLPGTFEGTYEAFLRCVHPEDRQFTIEAVNDCVEKGKEYNIEHRIIWPDGSIHWVSETGDVMRDKKGKAKRMLGIVQDITKRKNAEIALKESEERYRSVTQSAYDAIITANHLGKIVSWNKGAQNLFGYKEAEILNKPLTVLMPKYFREKHVKSFRQAITLRENNNLGKTLELQGLKKDESVFPLELSLSSWKIDQQIFYTGIIRDITERKEIEERKNEFLGIASHELKTPITTIKAFTQILKKRFERLADQEAVLYLSKIEDHINKLVNLVQDLLDVTRITSGKLKFYEDYFNFEHLIQDTMDNLQPIINGHKLIKQGKINVKVLADRYRIEQVLTNIILNAAQYSPDADKIIINASASKKHISVAVKDFGIGIPKAAIKRVFERFFRIENEKSYGFSGLGLGLFISSEIIKRHNGKIWVKSQEGKGSTFYFTLPIALNN